MIGRKRGAQNEFLPGGYGDKYSWRQVAKALGIGRHTIAKAGVQVYPIVRNGRVWGHSLLTREEFEQVQRYVLARRGERLLKSSRRARPTEPAE